MPSFFGTLPILSLFLLFLVCIDQSHQAVYSHAQALQLVNAAGISVSSSGGCSNRGNAQCTSLEGIHSEAIDGIITLKRASGCPIIITGATETGHESVGRRSHHNGWKIDIRKRGEDCITQYIKRTFGQISGSRWRAASGNVYLNEHNHWDIQYGNNVRDKRALDGENDAVDDDDSEEENLSKQSDEDSEQSNEAEGEEGEATNGPPPSSSSNEVNIFGRDKQEQMDFGFLPDHPQLELNLTRSGRQRRQANDKCFQCICQVESGCSPLNCKWDVNSLSCGYFQIKKEYYIDCRTPGRQAGEGLDTAWKRCAMDYGCSVQCIQNYVARYGFKCAGVGPCQKVSRLHNGGPNGCRKSATSGYWNKVDNCL